MAYSQTYSESESKAILYRQIKRFNVDPKNSSSKSIEMQDS